jgi:hypothetical protein
MIRVWQAIKVDGTDSAICKLVVDTIEDEKILKERCNSCWQYYCSVLCPKIINCPCCYHPDGIMICMFMNTKSKSVWGTPIQTAHATEPHMINFVGMKVRHLKPWRLFLFLWNYIEIYIYADSWLHKQIEQRTSWLSPVQVPFSVCDVYYIGHPLKMAICQGIKERSDHHLCA